MLVPGSCPVVGSCDFSAGLCGYTRVVSDPLFWLVGNGKTHDPATIVGPHDDSVGDEGMYAYMDFTKEGLKKNDQGKMISMALEATDNTCFSMWVNMFGTKEGVLLVERVSLT